MWHYSVTIQRIYVTRDAQNAWAVFDGINGWKRIKSGAADGVTNVASLLSTAHANNRQVDVYLADDKIQRAVLR